MKRIGLIIMMLLEVWKIKKFETALLEGYIRGTLPMDKRVLLAKEIEKSTEELGKLNRALVTINDINIEIKGDEQG